MATGRRRGRAFIYIALILILLLVLVFAYTRMGGLGLPGLQPQTEAPAAVEEVEAPAVIENTVDIVVTTQDVKRGQELTEGLLQVVAIPQEEYTDGVFFNTLEEVAGARSRYDLKAHTPLTSALVVAQDGVGSIPSFEIPKGMVAISIPVSKLSSVAYGLQKGDHVNLIASIMLVDLDTNWQTVLPNKTGVVIAPGPIDETQTNVTAVLTGPEDTPFLGRIEIDPTMNNPVYLLPSEPQRSRLVSQTLIQDIVVLEMGYFPLGEPTVQATPEGGQPAVEETQQDGEEAAAPAVVAPEIVTLIVSPQDAVTLNYLMLSNATLNMVMRSAGDDQKIDTEAVTLQFILDQYRIPVPAKLPYGVNPRVDKAPDRVMPFPEPGPVPTQLP